MDSLLSKWDVSKRENDSMTGVQINLLWGCSPGLSPRKIFNQVFTQQEPILVLVYP